jgi:cation diffusion facilitator CzcD-associated flavoprotein CzcO
MAKTDHQVDPDTSIIVLDKAESIGGVWANEKLYNFNTNNMLGSFEFSDFPTIEEHAGITSGQHIPAGKVHEYLSLYAGQHGLTYMIRFHTTVDSAELLDSG